jgi:RNA polymerase sigma-70 factor (ECF subfamily)
MENRAPQGQDELDLIARAQAYDPEAFSEIYDAYYGGIYKYIYYRVGDQVLAEDLAAEVFVRAMDSIDTYNFRGVPFSAWLYRIANNLVVDHFRRQPSQPVLPLEEKMIGDADALEMAFTQQALRKALSELTEEQKQVIILKFIDGLTNYEVAEVLGKTEGAVKSLQHRALATLGRLMAEQDEIAATG